MAVAFNPGTRVESAPSGGLASALVAGGGTTFADRTRGVGLSLNFSPTVTRQQAGFQGGIQASGLVAVGAILGLIWAIDRYHPFGADVPFVKAEA